MLPKACERSMRCFRHLQNNMQSVFSSCDVLGRKLEYTNSAELIRMGFTRPVCLMQSLQRSLTPHFSKAEMDRERWHITNGLLLGFWMRRNVKKRAIASVCRSARLQSMNPAVKIPVHFFTNDAESQKYEMRPEFVKFTVTNFMKWKSVECIYYLQNHQKATMEELCICHWESRKSWTGSTKCN